MRPDALFGDDLIDGITNKTIKKFRDECNCLPACKTIVYDVELLTGAPLLSFLQNNL